MLTTENKQIKPGQSIVIRAVAYRVLHVETDRAVIQSAENDALYLLTPSRDRVSHTPRYQTTILHPSPGENTVDNIFHVM